MINRTCENCANNEFEEKQMSSGCDSCQKGASNFILKEELVRRDEKQKMIEKIKKFYHTARNEKFSNSMNFLELLVYLKED